MRPWRRGPEGGGDAVHDAPGRVPGILVPVHGAERLQRGHAGSGAQLARGRAHHGLFREHARAACASGSSPELPRPAARRETEDAGGLRPPGRAHRAPHPGPEGSARREPHPAVPGLVLVPGRAVASARMEEPGLREHPRIPSDDSAGPRPVAPANEREAGRRSQLQHGPLRAGDHGPVLRGVPGVPGLPIGDSGGGGGDSAGAPGRGSGASSHLERDGHDVRAGPVRTRSGLGPGGAEPGQGGAPV